MSTTADVPSTGAPDTTGSSVAAESGPPGATATATEAPTSSSPADRFMRRLLRLPEGRTSTAAEARSAFQKSLAFSTVRCLLMYIVFPFVLPAVGIARGVGPAIGMVIGILAMISIVYSIRRFWRADHSKRWHYTIFGTAIIGFLIFLSIKDLTELL